MEIRGGVGLVTGASGMVGRAVARRLRDEGCSPVLAGRRGDLLETLAAEVEGRAVVGDLESVDDLRRVAATAGDVDVFVSCAAVGWGGELTESGLEDVGRVLDVNLRAPLLLARLLGEGMVARGRGHVVFVSSLAGKVAGAGSSVDSAARFGLRGFALGLRQDWGPLGVGVSLVNVGSVGVVEHAEGVALPAGFRGRTPEDVAAAVVRAVRHDRAEVDVADPVKRAGIVFGQLAPQVAARLQRFAGDETER